MGQVHFKTPDEIADEAYANWRENAKVSPFQARAVLARAGLLGQVQQLMGGKNQNSDEALAWEYATEIRRDSQLMLTLAGELGLTEQQLDDLFSQGETIEV